VFGLNCAKRSCLAILFCVSSLAAQSIGLPPAHSDWWKTKEGKEFKQHLLCTGAVGYLQSCQAHPRNFDLASGVECREIVKAAASPACMALFCDRPADRIASYCAAARLLDPGFLAFGNGKTVLRSNRQTLLSWQFDVPLAAMWGSTIACVRGRHTNNAPIGKGLLLDGYLPPAILSAFGYMFDRLLWRPIAVGMFTYATQQEIRGAVGHYYP